MLFNITKLKESLNEAMKKQISPMSPNTAKLYLQCITRLNDVLDEGASSQEIADAIMMVGGKSAESYKTAVSYYERKVLGQPNCLLYAKDKVNIKLDHHIRELYHKPRYYRDKIRDSKYRLAFTLQERGGLRVSEVSALTPNDVAIIGEDILIRVRHGKGNKARTVHCLPSNYLLEELPKFTDFPSENALKQEATALGFRTHDLRKVNARTRYWLAREDGMKKTDAIREVQAELGHEKTSMTRDYIGAELKKKKNDWGY